MRTWIVMGNQTPVYSHIRFIHQDGSSPIYVPLRTPSFELKLYVLGREGQLHHLCMYIIRPGLHTSPCIWTATIPQTDNCLNQLCRCSYVSGRIYRAQSSSRRHWPRHASQNLLYSKITEHNALNWQWVIVKEVNPKSQLWNIISNTKPIGHEIPECISHCSDTHISQPRTNEFSVPTARI